MSEPLCMLCRMDYRLSDEYGRAVAQQLRAEIAAAGHTVIDVAQRAEIPRVSLDRWLKGVRPLTVPNLYRVCAAIPIDPRTLIERATVRFHEQSSVPDATIRPIHNLSDYRKEPQLDDHTLAAGDVDDGDDGDD